LHLKKLSQEYANTLNDDVMILKNLENLYNFIFKYYNYKSIVQNP